MSSSVHSIILLPGSQFEYMCKDGLSPLEVQNVEHIFNFGGSMKAVNCSAEHEYTALRHARGDMWHLAGESELSHSSRLWKDFNLALDQNNHAL